MSLDPAGFLLTDFAFPLLTDTPVGFTLNRFAFPEAAVIVTPVYYINQGTAFNPPLLFGRATVDATPLTANRTQSLQDRSGTIALVEYVPAVPGNWVDPPPATIDAALDRLAAWIVANGGHP